MIIKILSRISTGADYFLEIVFFSVYRGCGNKYIIMNNITDIYLLRQTSTDQGTEGILAVPQLCFSSFTLELPWRDNMRDISCIPPGTYPLTWHESKKFKAFHVKDVPDRSGVLIHAGNVAGDTGKGFRTDVEGCILLGVSRGTLYGQRAVLHSRAAVDKLNNFLKDRLANGGQARIIIAWQAFEAEEKLQ